MHTEKKQFYRDVFALVLPMAAQNLINVAVTSADVVMLGRVGETVLSASSLAGQVQFIMTLIFFGLTSGASFHGSCTAFSLSNHGPVYSGTGSH